MIDCLDVARYFIIRAYDDGIDDEMTNMKVQKLLYYSQSLHLALYDEPLFDEEIQAWRYGPVCPPVYRFYSDFEARQLPIPKKEFLSQISHETKELLEEIWEYFGGYHAYLLSDMTHVEFPWKKARKGLPSDASSTEPILREDLRALGYQKLDEIERDHPAYEAVMSEVLQDKPKFLTRTSKGEDTPQTATRIRKGEVRAWLNSLLG